MAGKIQNGASRMKLSRDPDLRTDQAIDMQYKILIHSRCLWLYRDNLMCNN